MIDEGLRMDLLPNIQMQRTSRFRSAADLER